MKTPTGTGIRRLVGSSVKSVSKSVSKTAKHLLTGKSTKLPSPSGASSASSTGRTNVFTVHYKDERWHLTRPSWVVTAKEWDNYRRQAKSIIELNHQNKEAVNSRLEILASNGRNSALTVHYKNDRYYHMLPLWVITAEEKVDYQRKVNSIVEAEHLNKETVYLRLAALASNAPALKKDTHESTTHDATPSNSLEEDKENNVEHTNVERATERTNVERTNVERTNVERTNVERANVERTNVERANERASEAALKKAAPTAAATATTPANHCFGMQLGKEATENLNEAYCRIRQEAAAIRDNPETDKNLLARAEKLQSQLGNTMKGLPPSKCTLAMKSVSVHLQSQLDNMMKGLSPSKCLKLVSERDWGGSSNSQGPVTVRLGPNNSGLVYPADIVVLKKESSQDISVVSNDKPPPTHAPSTEDNLVSVLAARNKVHGTDGVPVEVQEPATAMKKMHKTTGLVAVEETSSKKKSGKGVTMSEEAKPIGLHGQEQQQPQQERNGANQTDSLIVVAPVSSPTKFPCALGNPGTVPFHCTLSPILEQSSPLPSRDMAPVGTPLQAVIGNTANEILSGEQFQGVFVIDTATVAKLFESLNGEQCPESCEDDSYYASIVADLLLLMLYLKAFTQQAAPPDTPEGVNTNRLTTGTSRVFLEDSRVALDSMGKPRATQGQKVIRAASKFSESLEDRGKAVATLPSTATESLALTPDGVGQLRCYNINMRSVPRKEVALSNTGEFLGDSADIFNSAGIPRKTQAQKDLTNFIAKHSEFVGDRGKNVALPSLRTCSETNDPALPNATGTPLFRSLRGDELLGLVDGVVVGGQMEDEIPGDDLTDWETVLSDFSKNLFGEPNTATPLFERFENHSQSLFATASSNATGGLGALPGNPLPGGNGMEGRYAPTAAAGLGLGVALLYHSNRKRKSNQQRRQQQPKKQKMSKGQSNQVKTQKTKGPCNQSPSLLWCSKHPASPGEQPGKPLPSDQFSRRQKKIDFSLRMCKTCCNNHKKKEVQPELAILQADGATLQQEVGRNLDGVDKCNLSDDKEYNYEPAKDGDDDAGFIECKPKKRHHKAPGPAVLAQAPEGDAAVPLPVPGQDGVARKPPPVHNKSTSVAKPPLVPGQDDGVARKRPPVRKSTFVPAKAPTHSAWKTPNDGFLMGGGNLEDFQPKLSHTGVFDKPPMVPTNKGEKENGEEKSDDHSPLGRSNLQPSPPPKPLIVDKLRTMRESLVDDGDDFLKQLQGCRENTPIVDKLRNIRESLKSEDADDFLNQVQLCSKTASNMRQKNEGMRSRSSAIQDELSHQISTAEDQLEAESQTVLNLEVAAKEGGTEIVEEKSGKEKSGDDDSQLGDGGNEEDPFPLVEGDEEEETKDENSDNDSPSDDESKGLSVGGEGNTNSMGGDSFLSNRGSDGEEERNLAVDELTKNMDLSGGDEGNCKQLNNSSNFSLFCSAHQEYLPISNFSSKQATGKSDREKRCKQCVEKGRMNIDTAEYAAFHSNEGDVFYAARPLDNNIINQYYKKNPPSSCYENPTASDKWKEAVLDERHQENLKKLYHSIQQTKGKNMTKKKKDEFPKALRKLQGDAKNLYVKDGHGTLLRLSVPACQYDADDDYDNSDRKWIADILVIVKKGGKFYPSLREVTISQDQLEALFGDWGLGMAEKWREQWRAGTLTSKFMITDEPQYFRAWLTSGLVYASAKKRSDGSLVVQTCCGFNQTFPNPDDFYSIATLWDAQGGVAPPLLPPPDEIKAKLDKSKPYSTIKFPAGASRSAAQTGNSASQTGQTGTDMELLIKHRATLEAWNCLQCTFLECARRLLGQSYVDFTRDAFEKFESDCEALPKDDGTPLDSLSHSLAYRIGRVKFLSRGHMAKGFKFDGTSPFTSDNQILAIAETKITETKEAGHTLGFIRIDGEIFVVDTSEEYLQRVSTMDMEQWVIKDWRLFEKVPPKKRKKKGKQTGKTK